MIDFVVLKRWRLGFLFFFCFFWTGRIVCCGSWGKGRIESCGGAPASQSDVTFTKRRVITANGNGPGSPRASTAPIILTSGVFFVFIRRSRINIHTRRTNLQGATSVSIYTYIYVHPRVQPSPARHGPAAHFNNTPSVKIYSTQTLKSSKSELKRGEVSWQTTEQNAMQSYAAQGMK